MKTILVDAKWGLVLEDGTIFEEMLELLETYPNSKIVLTGANDEEFKELNLDKVPYEVFTLKHDPDKTDSAYYMQFLEKYQLNADDVICFEHKASTVKSAQSVGIPTYFYDPAQQDLVALKSFIDANL